MKKIKTLAVAGISIMILFVIFSLGIWIHAYYYMFPTGLKLEQAFPEKPSTTANNKQLAMLGVILKDENIKLIKNIQQDYKKECSNSEVTKGDYGYKAGLTDANNKYPKDSPLLNEFGGNQFKGWLSNVETGYSNTCIASLHKLNIETLSNLIDTVSSVSENDVQAVELGRKALYSDGDVLRDPLYLFSSAVQLPLRSDNPEDIKVGLKGLALGLNISHILITNTDSYSGLEKGLWIYKRSASNIATTVLLTQNAVSGDDLIKIIEEYGIQDADMPRIYAVWANNNYLSSYGHLSTIEKLLSGLQESYIKAFYAEGIRLSQSQSSRKIIDMNVFAQQINEDSLFSEFLPGREEITQHISSDVGSNLTDVVLFPPLIQKHLLKIVNQ